MIIPGGGGGAGVRLAPEIEFFSSRFTPGDIWKAAAAIDATGALTEVFALTGKWSLSLLELASMTVDDLSKIKLTIDGVTIWDEVGLVSNAAAVPLISPTRANQVGREDIRVDSSLSLEVQMLTDPSITVVYMARPIL